MKTILFYLQKSNLLKHITSSVYEEEGRSLLTCFKDIIRNPFRKRKEPTPQSNLYSGIEEFRQTTNGYIIKELESNRNYVKEIYSISNYTNKIFSKTTRPTYIAPSASYIQNIAYDSASMYCPDLLPFNVIYNTDDDNTSWIITIMHNIRANGALKKYILKNLNSNKIKKGLKSILKINGEHIKKKQHNLVTQFYAPGEDLWKERGDEVVFLESLLEGLYSNRNFKNLSSSNSKTYFFKKLYNGTRSQYEIYRNARIPKLPYFYLRPSPSFPCHKYFDVTNVFRGERQNSNNIAENYQNSLPLDYCPGFMVLNLNRLRNSYTKSLYTKGLKFDKEIDININGISSNQRYSLTGISLRENRNGLEYAKSLIKIGNMWFDIDYESVKHLNKHTGTRYRIPELTCGLNKNDNQISIDYTSGEATRFFVLICLSLRATRPLFKKCT